MYNMDIQNRCTELMYKINVLTYKIEVPKSTSKINIQNQYRIDLQNWPIWLTKSMYRSIELMYRINVQKYRINVQNRCTESTYRNDVQNWCTKSMFKIDLFDIQNRRISHSKLTYKIDVQNGRTKKTYKMDVQNWCTKSTYKIDAYNKHTK